MNKGKQINWTEECLKCQGKHDGACPSIACAKYHYDEWGDPIPRHLHHLDGNNVQKYLEEKRKRMETIQN